MTKTTYTTVAGPAGGLEVMVCEPDRTCRNLVVLCHPHPLYGGNMHDGVLQIAAEALLQESIGVVRFNFRGVGNSEGISGRSTNTEKSGRQYLSPEVGDLLATTQWAKTRFSVTAPVHAGYSFGSHVLWHALPMLACKKALLIAPPAAAMSFAVQPTKPVCSVHALWCNGDDFVDPLRFLGDPNVAITELSGGDHFFTGQTDALAETVKSVLC